MLLVYIVDALKLDEFGPMSSARNRRRPNRVEVVIAERESRRSAEHHEACRGDDNVAAPQRRVIEKSG
jgi:hypothetical protein